MPDKYIVQKVPVVFQVQSNRNGRNSPDPAPGFEWHIRNYETGQKIGDSYRDQQKAEDACLKLNQKSQ